MQTKKKKKEWVLIAAPWVFIILLVFVLLEVILQCGAGWPIFEQEGYLLRRNGSAGWMSDDALVGTIRILLASGEKYPGNADGKPNGQPQPDGGHELPFFNVQAHGLGHFRVQDKEQKRALPDL